MNENMAAVASSIALLGSSLKRSHDEPNSSSQSNKKRKMGNGPTLDNDQRTGDESDNSSHSDSAELGAIMAAKETTKWTAESSNLLSQIPGDFDNDENTIFAVNEKLAEIINKRFSAPLGEEKLKEKLEQYLRPDNCAKLAVPKVNLCKSFTMNADALALLDHANHQLYGPVLVDTVSRSIKATLTNAGVNTDVFPAHSTRSAPTSTAASKQIPLDIVMKSAYPGRKSSK